MSFLSGSQGTETLEKTKHATWFLTCILKRLVPNLDSLDTCQGYLEDLGRRHARAGVRIEHLDLLALAYCQSVRSVAASQGEDHTKCQKVNESPLGKVLRSNKVSFKK